jgi:hypothetical protein
VQFDLLKTNFKKKYKELNVYFIVQEHLIKLLNLGENFITLDFFEKNKNLFSKVEEFQVLPKLDSVENYCINNDIDLCVNDQTVFSNGTRILVYTNSFSCNKSLSDKDLCDLRKIFGNTLIVNSESFDNAKYVIGPECWQIFKSASKKIPTWIVSNKGNYTDLFLKMFPKQKKIEL